MSSTPPPAHAGAPAGTPLGEIAWLFLRLGATSFGGPAAHIAMMEHEVVTRRRWLPRERFLDLLGATHLIPGPSSTELAIHIGHVRGGWPGLLVAGLCFILPAACLVTALAWAYVRVGTAPRATALLHGIQPVVLAVVVQALWRLGRGAITSPLLGGVALAAVVAQLLGAGEIAVLAGAGVVVAVARRAPHGGAPPDEGRAVPPPAAAVAPLAALPAGAAVTAATTAVGLWPLFLFFAKVGSVLFGSGYVLLAFLRAGLVVERGWLTDAQLLDAIAIGQVTPGPLFTTATFIGYLLGGGAGALVATAGIFLPAFLFVAASGPLVPRLRRSPAASAALDGVNAASVALMGVVTVQLGRAALVDPFAVTVAVAAALLLFRGRVPVTWLVAGGAVAGLLFHAG